MPMKKGIIYIILACLVLLVFSQAVGNLEAGRQAEGLAQLEEAVRRTAVTCYAAEGFYPPSVAYMQEHYGLQFDESAYIIHYQVLASNLMPDITVLERK